MYVIFATLLLLLSVVSCSEAATDLYYPAGTYILTGLSLASNTRLHGAGKNLTTLSLDSSVSPDTNLITISYASGVTIDNLTLIGGNRSYNGDNNRFLGNCIFSDHSTDITVHDVYMTACQGGYVDNDGSNIRLRYDDFVFNQNGFAGVQLRGSQNVVLDHLQMTDTVAVPNGMVNAIFAFAGETPSDGIDISYPNLKGFSHSGYEAIVLFSTHFRIDHARIIGKDRTNGAGATSDHRGIDITANSNNPAGDGIITAPVIENEGYGIRVKSLTNGITVPNVAILGGSIKTVSQACVDVEDGATDTAIVGVKCQDSNDLGNTSPSFGCGINVLGAVVGATVVDSRVNQTTKNGIFVWSGVSHFLVEDNWTQNNTGHGIASQGTPVSHNSWGIIEGNQIWNTIDTPLSVLNSDSMITVNNLF